MAETVFILGAGASAAMGTPLLANFFDVARRLASESDDPEFRSALDKFTRIHVALQRSAAKSHVDLYSLESVWGCMEMAEILGGFPGVTAEQIREGRVALEYLIALTINGSMKLAWGHGPNENSAGEILVPTALHYLMFLGQLKAMIRARRVAFLTFNYDLGLDIALAAAGHPVDYSLAPESEPDSVPLLKLHGSLNWFRQEPRADINHWPVPRGLPIEDANRTGASRPPSCQAWFMNEWRTCFMGSAGLRPIVIPPGDSKLGGRKQLRTVWARAATELRDARRIVVVGFSLPPTDEFFRILFGLGTIGDYPLEQVLVIDPSPQARARLKDVLSRQAQSRFTEVPVYFDQSLFNDGGAQQTWRKSVLPLLS